MLLAEGCVGVSGLVGERVEGEDDVRTDADYDLVEVTDLESTLERAIAVLS